MINFFLVFPLLGAWVESEKFVISVGVLYMKKRVDISVRAVPETNGGG